jgi:hypothetical protein
MRILSLIEEEEERKRARVLDCCGAQWECYSFVTLPGEVMLLICQL